MNQLHNKEEVKEKQGQMTAYMGSEEGGSRPCDSCLGPLAASGTAEQAEEYTGWAWEEDSLTSHRASRPQEVCY